MNFYIYYSHISERGDYCVLNLKEFLPSQNGGETLNNGEEIKGKTMQITLIIAPLGSEITKIQRWLEICGLSARHRKYRGSLTL